MDRAGVETWLMHVLRSVDRSQFQMDFLVHSEVPAHFDTEIRSLGSRILYGMPLKRTWKYGSAIRNQLRQAPPYDIVHAHLDYFSGFALKVANQAGVPVRIAHSHNDLTRSFAGLRWSRQLFAARGRSLALRHATHGLACCFTAGQSMFGKQRSSVPWKVLPYGIELSPFLPVTSHQDFRREFGIPDDTLIIGHVGRFFPQKNHALIIRIADALRRRGADFRLVLVGDGPLRSKIETDIHDRGLCNYITLTGVRADIPRLFTSLFDVFLFPSLFEGLPVVLIEAQAAGCPTVISDVISPEIHFVQNLVKPVSLTADAEQWADAVLHSAGEPRSREQRLAALKTIRNSPGNIDNCVESLTNLYLREASARKAA